MYARAIKAKAQLVNEKVNELKMREAQLQRNGGGGGVPIDVYNRVKQQLDAMLSRQHAFRTMLATANQQQQHPHHQQQQQQQQQQHQQHMPYPTESSSNNNNNPFIQQHMEQHMMMAPLSLMSAVDFNPATSSHMQQNMFELPSPPQQHQHQHQQQQPIVPNFVPPLSNLSDDFSPRKAPQFDDASLQHHHQQQQQQQHKNDAASTWVLLFIRVKTSLPHLEN